MDTIMEMDNHFSFTVRISTNQRNRILVHLFDWLFYALKTPANQWLKKLSYKHDILNILSLAFFFSQNWPFDTLYVQLHYTLTP